MATLLEPAARRAHGHADAEAGAGAGVLTVLVPGDKPPHQVRFGEIRVSLQAVYERQCHRHVVGPLTGVEPEWTIPPAEAEAYYYAANETLDMVA